MLLLLSLKALMGLWLSLLGECTDANTKELSLNANVNTFTYIYGSTCTLSPQPCHVMPCHAMLARMGTRS